MDVVRKISEQGNLFLNEDMLNHMGIKRGDFVIVRGDRGKYGPFVSVFKPQLPEHKQLVKLEEQQHGGR